jgi:hypothetical protein
MAVPDGNRIRAQRFLAAHGIQQLDPRREIRPAHDGTCRDVEARVMQRAPHLVALDDFAARERAEGVSALGLGREESLVEVVRIGNSKPLSLRV